MARRSHRAAFLMTDQTSGPTEGLELRDRIDRYLRAAASRRDAPESCRSPATPPTAGTSASSVPTARRSVLALHAGPIDFATLPFANVAELLRADAAAGPRDPRPLRRATASWRCRISATSRCRRTSVRRRRPSTRPVSRGGRAHRAAAAARAPSWRPTATCPTGSRSTSRSSPGSSTSSSSTSSRRYRGAALSDARAGGARRGVGGDRRGARRRAARAVPSRLSQPQSDAARRHACTSSTSRTRAWDPTPTISCRCCAIRTSTSPTRARRSDRATSWRCKGRNPDGREFRRRFDLMALQRNLKALGTFGYQTITRAQSRSTSSTCREPCATRAPISRSTRASRGFASCWPRTSRSCGRLDAMDWIEFEPVHNWRVPCFDPRRTTLH